jgi:hypothetical protein
VLAFIATATTLILTVPTIQAVLGFASLGLIELGVVLAIGVVLLLIFELTKFAGRRTL